jgi:hypothetical protein
MWTSKYWANAYFARRYWAKEAQGGPVFMRRPNMMRVGSRGEWIFKTVN